MDQCPRGGYALLYDIAHEHVVRTVCKTWGCSVCRKKLRSLVAMRIAYGLSTLGHCYFITVTYRAGEGIPTRDVDGVARDLKLLWAKLKQSRRWKRSKDDQVAWFKVVEFTKRGQVHLHFVVGNLEGRPKASCRAKNGKYARWRHTSCQSDCLEHELSAVWEEVTGDSYVVDASVVASNGKTAWYLIKYVCKSLVDDDRRLEAGFARRYSTSQNWPRVEMLQLRGTVEGRWREVALRPKVTQWWNQEPVDWETGEIGEALSEQILETMWCPNMEQVGGEYALAIVEKNERNKVERFQNVNSNQT